MSVLMSNRRPKSVTLDFLNFYHAPESGQACKVAGPAIGGISCRALSSRVCTLLGHWNGGRKTAREHTIQTSWNSGPNLMLMLVENGFLGSAFPPRSGR